jgi:hypothetical protein
MRVDDIRGQLRRRGVSGISALRKPELVKVLVRTLRTEGRAGGAARAATGPAGRAAGRKATAGARKAAGGRRSTTTRAKAAPAPARKAAPARKGAPARTAATARKTATARKATPAKKATPTKKTAVAKKAAPARKTAVAKKAAPAGKTAAARKAAPAKKAGTRTAPAAKRAPARKSVGKQAPARPAARRAAPTGTRTGASSSRSARTSQVITSLQDRPERPGRSLVTTNHDVIRRWAEARGARPATIAGTERQGRPGVLTFNMPGYRESSRIREVSWDDWFRTFDERGVNLIYQEQLRDGRQSNFFRTEAPHREDA